MACVNSVVLAGRVARDVDLRAGQDESLFVSVNLLLTEEFTKRDGTDGQSKTFVDLKVNGNVAQAAKDLKEGDFVVARGKLRTDSWEDKTTGKKVYKLVVQVDQLILADGDGSPVHDDANMPATVGAAKQEEIPW